MDPNKFDLQLPSFLPYEPKTLEYSIFQLNLYLCGYSTSQKPYTIDYHLLLMSYHANRHKDLDEFCQNQTISYFLMHPNNDSAEAREAFYIEIREFLLKL
nr:hypothetical protein [Allomuricauda sp.]